MYICDRVDERSAVYKLLYIIRWNVSSVRYQSNNKFWLHVFNVDEHIARVYCVRISDSVFGDLVRNLVVVLFYGQYAEHGVQPSDDANVSSVGAFVNKLHGCEYSGSDESDGIANFVPDSVPDSVPNSVPDSVPNSVPESVPNGVSDVRVSKLEPKYAEPNVG